MPKHSSDYSRGSRRFLIATLLESGKTRTETYRELLPMLRDQVEPLVFKANPAVKGGHRIAKSMPEQVRDFRYEINRVAKEMSRTSGDDFRPDDIPADDAPEPDFSPEPDVTPEPEPDATPEPDIDPEPEPEPDKPTASGKVKLRDEFLKFKTRIREIRAELDRRAELGERLDSVSMRPAQASRLIALGVPADFLLYAMAMHWPSDARRDMGIIEAEPAEFSRNYLEPFSVKVMADFGVTPEDGFHPLFGYALLLALARQPIMLVGPFGTGKSFLAEQVAKFLDMKYGETPMTPGATRGDLLGRHTLAGFIPAEFTERYSTGGVFNFEEIDASDPSMLIVLNNALAGNALYNSSNGEKCEKSGNFVPASTANTFGLGANSTYTGRERLDAATIDRWRMGRIFVPLSEVIEDSIFDKAFAEGMEIRSEVSALETA